MEMEKKECAAPASDVQRQVYVTMESARKASYEIIGRHLRPFKDELVLQQKKLYNEILEKYTPIAIPTDEEQKNLSLVNNLQVFYKKENGEVVYYNIWGLHRGIKPVTRPVEISSTYYLALCGLDNAMERAKSNEERMANRRFEEIMYLRDKQAIETLFPEIVPFLEFMPFIYDTLFWKDIISKTVEM